MKGEDYGRKAYEAFRDASMPQWITLEFQSRARWVKAARSVLLLAAREYEQEIDEHGGSAPFHPRSVI